MYRSSPFRSTLNTGYITALDMCEVCTEAVHSVAPWTRVTSQLWTSVKYEPPSDTFVHISTTLTRFYVSRTILRLHFRGAWFGNSTTLPRLYLWHPANSTTLTRAPNQPGALNNQDSMESKTFFLWLKWEPPCWHRHLTPFCFAAKGLFDAGNPRNDTSALPVEKCKDVILNHPVQWWSIFSINNSQIWNPWSFGTLQI